MMIRHSVEHGVLVITVHDDPGIGGRATLLTQISDLVLGHQPASLVIILNEPAATDAAVNVVLRAHRLCNRLGLVMSVTTHSAPVRRSLEANADTNGTRLVIYARADTAIATAGALTAVAVPAGALACLA
ncbi:hypothetical protein [Streptomyces sp. NPDC005209]|uniref:hypothetical protein n=1 Tax=Streptomyces sp. NPDC005209 TaxID=3156715 RepID=UPI0033ABDF9D